MNDKPMDESERVARLICQALHANVEPDERVARSPPPMLIGGFYIVRDGDDNAVPLWRMYQGAADKVIDYFERKEEQAARARRSDG